MRTVDLGKNISGINKQNFILLYFRLIKEPQGSRQRNRGKHIGWQRYHLADNAAFNQLYTNILFTVTCIRCRICHNQSSTTGIIQRSCKLIDPKVVAVRNGFFGIFLFAFCFVLRNTVGIKTRLILNLIQFYAIHIERWICHNIIKITKAIIRITIIGVCMGNGATDIVKDKVHLCQSNGCACLFYAISTQVHLLALSFVLFNIMGSLNEHTAATASWVENPTLSRRKDFNHVTDNRCRGEEFTAALTFRQCKFTQEVFINLTEDVKLYIRRNILKVLQELCQYKRIILTVNAVINVLWKSIFQFSGVFLNRFHSFLHLLGKIFAFRQIQQPIISSFFRQIETAFFDSDFMDRAFHTSTLDRIKLCLDLRFELAIFYICKSQENQTENRFGVFRGLQARIST